MTEAVIVSTARTPLTKAARGAFVFGTLLPPAKNARYPQTDVRVLSVSDLAISAKLSPRFSTGRRFTNRCCSSREPRETPGAPMNPHTRKVESRGGNSKTSPSPSDAASPASAICACTCSS